MTVCQAPSPSPTAQVLGIHLVTLSPCHLTCGGRIRTGVERLMRPCWKPTPVHSAVTKGRVELPRPEGPGVLSAVRLPVPPQGQFQQPVGESNPSGQLERLAASPKAERAIKNHVRRAAGFTPAGVNPAARRVRRAGVEPAQRSRVGYSHLGSPMPSRRKLQ